MHPARASPRSEPSSRSSLPRGVGRDERGETRDRGSSPTDSENRRMRRRPSIAALALVAGALLSACESAGAVPPAQTATLSVPVPPPGEALLGSIRQVSAGTRHTCALDAEGHVWCWGENATGQLGDGSRVDHDAPVRVRALPPARSIRGRRRQHLRRHAGRGSLLLGRQRGRPARQRRASQRLHDAGAGPASGAESARPSPRARRRASARSPKRAASRAGGG